MNLIQNHVGAGDCFAIHLALGLAHGLNLAEAATVAHSAGRVYVQHRYGRPPWPHEIRKDIDPAGGKVVPASWAERTGFSCPRPVVLANGCFDLLGPHHVYLLQEAKKFGATLVVAVNDDDSVRRLKGPSRPVIPLPEREAMLTGLECVDWVMSFGNDTPVEVIKALQPDFLVKGDDPRRNTAGDELVKEVKLIPLKVGWSTSDTLIRINESGRR